MSHILIADDDPDFVMLLKTAFEELHSENVIRVVEDGLQARAYLKNESPFENRQQWPIPGLIVSDLRLPPDDGISLTCWIRQQPFLDGLPVVILTGSELPDKEELSLRSGASGYFIKPFQFTKLVALAQQLRDTWLRHEEHFASQAKL